MQSRALHGLCETGLNQTAIGKLIPIPHVFSMFHMKMAGAAA